MRMAAIAPFRALRYNLDVVGDLSAVVAPPYDVISPQQQDALYQASPYNVVRLILGKESPADRASDNRYTRARQTLDEWRARGVLVQDDAPAFYLCEHAFTWEGRRFTRAGFLARLEFDGSVPDHVLAHEATFDAPKADRARLLEAVQANLSPVFCVLSDPARTVAGLMDQEQRQPPLMTVKVGEEAVRLWALTDPALIRRIQQHVAGAKVLIADGHHRFAVALAHRHLCPGVMSYFAWAEDPALLMQPIHRVIRLPGEAEAAWQAQLAKLCVVEPAGSLEEVTRWLASSDGQGRFGCYAQGRFARVRLRDEVLAEWLLHPSVPLALAGLDVTILHQMLLPGLCESAGLPSTTLPLYTPRPAEAVAAAREGGCAFLLRPMRLSQVFALAQQGFTLPQKTTYFHPKALSGLVLNPFQEVTVTS
ncbi:MAG: DUF1015 domain-containing protein [Candidatus Omnitrophica bacterium]|nr:DUF1015 domain-containing protein [Candidatus Omnitrophota bacterium]